MDHVFPESWYPDTTAAGLEKWKMPACSDCNRRHGDNERELLARFGLCLNANDPATASIVRKALRAINPACGKNPRDRAARAALRAQLQEEMRVLDAAAIERHKASLVPGFDNVAGRTPEEIRGINMPAERLRMLGEKVIRGVYYIDGGRILDDSLTAQVWLFHEAPPPITAALARWGRLYAREPGIRVVRAAADPADGHGDGCLFAIEVWQRLTLYGAVLPRDRLRTGPRGL